MGQSEASSDLVSVLMTTEAANRFLKALSYAVSIVRLRAEELEDSEGTSRRVQTAIEHAEWLRWGYRWVEAHREGRDCPDCGHLRVNHGPSSGRCGVPACDCGNTTEDEA